MKQENCEASKENPILCGSRKYPGCTFTKTSFLLRVISSGRQSQWLGSSQESKGLKAKLSLTSIAAAPRTVWFQGEITGCSCNAWVCIPCFLVTRLFLFITTAPEDLGLQKRGLDDRPGLLSPKLSFHNLIKSGQLTKRLPTSPLPLPLSQSWWMVLPSWVERRMFSCFRTWGLLVIQTANNHGLFAKIK